MTGPGEGDEPTGRKPSSPPPVKAGAFWHSPFDFYMKHKDESSIIDGSAWKVTGGVTFTYAQLLMDKTTMGWEHKTIVGATRSIHAPFDNKANVGFVANYIGKVKDEKTSGNKNEYILGVKYNRVQGKKYRMESGTQVLASDIEKAQKNKTLDEHAAVADKIVAKILEEEIKNLEEEHSRVQSIIGKFEKQYDNVDADIDKYTQKCTAFTSGIEKYREECDNVAAKYSGTFKNIASAAHEVTASATSEITVKANAKFVAQGLAKLGAALIQAG